ncbi:ABC transporter permease [Gaopeijia maritima]|uniref:ABC transporter permease n=1 Tax=Gaopeijia maritima TaxID=3119007 RepID=A0ABU9EDJ2_9BACT
MKGAPPRRWRRLLETLLPGEVRDGIVGDLDEVHAARSRDRGRLRAHLWYVAQVVSIGARFTVERVRDGLSLRGLSIGLDLKLGLRLAARTPMLTLVGGVAVAVATALGVGASEFVRDLVSPELPLDEGERVVRVLHADAASGGMVRPTLHDVARWKDGASSLTDLGAFLTREQGFSSEGGESGTVQMARVTASMFDLTRVAPRMGRVLIDADEVPGADPVVVLSDRAWSDLLAGEPDPVGRIVTLGGVPTTVVGVMPEGFGFPMNQDAWVPLVADPADDHPETATPVNVFGRLAEGVGLEAAEAELERLAGAAAVEWPGVHERLEPRVGPFAGSGVEGRAALILAVVRLLFVVLLVVVCANVATLVFARTVMREGEIAVRTSLGASRQRIVLQLFAEAAVLVGVATAIGLGAARLALGGIGRLFFTIQQEPRPPFWWNDALSPTTVVYAVGLALVGTVMIGVVPALKATGGSVRPRLSGGSGGGLRFGGMWTAVIVVQVALSVAILPIAASRAGEAFESREDPGFEATRVLTGQLGRDVEVVPRTPEQRGAFLESTRSLFAAVGERLERAPGVAEVAFASGLSGMNHLLHTFELVGDGSGPPTLARARVLLVDDAYLGLMGAEVVAGRALAGGDHTPEARSVVVNQSFVDRVLEGRNPVGTVLRWPEDGGDARLPWFAEGVEVVGVVEDPGIDRYGPGAHPAVYASLALAPLDPRAAGLVGMPDAPAVQLFVALRPGAEPLGSGLFTEVAGVDGSLRLSEVGTAADAWRSVHLGERIGGWVFTAIAGIVVMLSVAGIFALMSFAVTRRTREIAIRCAMGARRSEIVRAVFGRASLQLLAGVALGSVIALPTLWSDVTTEGLRTLMVVSAVLLLAGLASCLVPVRRALAIEPATAMKSE